MTSLYFHVWQWVYLASANLPVFFFYSAKYSFKNPFIHFFPASHKIYRTLLLLFQYFLTIHSLFFPFHCYYFYTLNFTWLILLQFLFLWASRMCKVLQFCIHWLFICTDTPGRNKLANKGRDYAEIMYLVKMLYISITETGLALAFWLDI